MSLILFFFGAAAGSFLGVVVERYNSEKFLLSSDIIGGRSFCPNCRVNLRWFELIPLVSFIIQLGRCRNCGKRISFFYPLIEILTGAVFVSVFLKVQSLYCLPYSLSFVICNLSFIPWLLIFSILIVASFVDFNTYLIPDEVNLFLGALALPIILLGSFSFGPASGSFLGSYALLLGFRENIFFNHFLAALFAAALFLFLTLVTFGKGMGVGDLKLASAIGFVFGWPDIFLIIILSFLIGGLASVISLAFGKKSLKSRLPFGPFLAASSFFVFLLGFDMLKFYFGLFGLF